MGGEVSLFDTHTMDSFKTKKGRCIVTDDAVRLESPFLARFKRTYEGSKLLFIGVMLLFGYMIVSLVIDRFIFWRPIVVWAVIIAASIGVLKRIVIYFLDQTLDDRIPLQRVKRVTLNEVRNRPVFFIHYEKDGSAVYRAIPLPSSRYEYTKQEVETAKGIFAHHGFPVEEVENK